MSRYDNPFSILKSVDLTFKELNELWVDLNSNNSGFAQIIKPTSAMPMILLGGKGCGKTHVIKHFTYDIQRLRHSNSISDGICRDGYLGVYFCFGGLNEERLQGKGISETKWEDLRVYYLDLCITEQLLINYQLFISDINIDIDEPLFCSKIYNLFYKPNKDIPQTLHDLIEFVHNLIEEIDYAVNNCSFTGELNVEILLNRGVLITKVPDIFREIDEKYSSVKTLYIFDELENIGVCMQKYIQTLIRECKKPSSISMKICGRLYSIETYETYSAGERNIRDSEFELIKLDDELRSLESDVYKKFVVDISLLRVKKSSIDIKLTNDFNDCFVKFNKSMLCEKETNFLISKESPKRKYFINFKKELSKLALTEKEIIEIISLLEYPEYPIIEKTNIRLFYRAISNKKNKKVNTLDIALNISNSAKEYCANKKANKLHSSELSHYKMDLLAQILKENNEFKYYYSGINTFITMSCGITRNYLRILRNIYSEAVLFKNESKLSPLTPISFENQYFGVRKASIDFFEDALEVSNKYDELKNSISKLGVFFADIRFSNIPPECSVLSFSTNSEGLSKHCSNLIKHACETSLLIKIPKGRKDRNSLSNQLHYQLNPMLSPLWDLPISRRGVISLDSNFVNSIFDSLNFPNHKELKKEKLKKWNIDTISYSKQGRLEW